MRRSTKKQDCFWFGCELHTHKKASPVLDCLWLEKNITQPCYEQFQHIERLSATHAGKEKHASFPCAKLEASDKPTQLTGACRSTDRLIQKPNQLRLLSTQYNSWHSISNAIWQLKATFATSQSCKKWAIALGSTSQICLSPLVALIFSFSLSNFLIASLCCFPNTFLSIYQETSNLVLLCSELSSISFWKPRPQILDSHRTIPVFGKTDL